MNQARLEESQELPLYLYGFYDTAELTFSERCG